MTEDVSALLARLARLAELAGAAIMEVYARDFDVRAKADASPVTEADERAEVIIVAGLRELTPDIPVVAEEMVAAGRAPRIEDGPFWLVDPLDGTREFV
ncbi:MAG: inositol monophosphatase family protein, partial [Alphaproteobacteria bacterium]